MSVAEEKAGIVLPGRKSRAASGVRSQHDERVATELSRNAAARERFDFLLKTIYGLIATIFLLSAITMYLALQDTKYRYFAVDPNGGVRELVPLDRPIQSTVELLNWSTIALTRAFTMSFSTYQQQMAETKLSFTDAGWAGFEEALRQTRLVSTIIDQKFVTSAVPNGAPVIVSQGIGEGGRYGWRVQMPVKVTFESASARRVQDYQIEAIIMRRSEIEHPSGLGIDRIIAR